MTTIGSAERRDGGESGLAALRHRIRSIPGQRSFAAARVPTLSKW
jgi:hypothetical protein